MFCAGLGGINANNNTVAGALAGAAAIFDTPNGLTSAGGFAGLSAQQLATLANWGPITLQSFVVPTLTEWSLLLLSILVVGVAGLILYRRRRVGGDLRA